MAKSISKITVSKTEITVTRHNNEDYISLTDMAGYKDTLEARVVVSNWMSTHYTIDFLAVWEQINNPNFNRMGFHTVRNGEGRLILTPKRWVEMTNSIGISAKEWRGANPDKTGNIRDYATIEQLVVLSNMESINALLIRQELSQNERLIELNKVAITQMKSLLANNTMKKISNQNDA